MAFEGDAVGVRIVDIARMAGVSPATVSLALNDKPGVGEKTRRKIRSIARKLDYKAPAPAVRAPAATESLCLLHIARHGHTVNRDHDVFIADYIEGLGRGATEAGMSLEIASFKQTGLPQILAAAQQHPGAGLVVLGTELSEADVESFAAVRKPLVFLDTYHEFLPFDFVDMNNQDAVFTVVSHLQARGHRRIGMVKGALEARNLRLREEAFVASLARCGLRLDERDLFAVDPTFHGAHADMLRHLARSTDLPTALFCGNDVIACGCLKALRARGVQVPQDVSLIGFDDLPLASVVDPPLTTVEVSKAEIGRMAITLLVNRIRQGNSTPPVKVLVGGRLVERQSVRTMPDAAVATSAR